MLFLLLSAEFLHVVSLLSHNVNKFCTESGEARELSQFSDIFGLFGILNCKFERNPWLITLTKNKYWCFDFILVEFPPILLSTIFAVLSLSKLLLNISYIPFTFCADNHII